MSSTPRHRHCFVIRAAGTWTLTPLPTADPETLDIDRVVALLGPSGEHAVPPERPAEEMRLSPEDRLAPAWMTVGLVAGGRFVVEGPAGTEVALDAGDLRLLDTLVAPSTPWELADGDGARIDDVLARCARLLAAGCAIPYAG